MMDDLGRDRKRFFCLLNYKEWLKDGHEAKRPYKAKGISHFRKVV
ncbi:hypothetical protein SBF1_1970017 [Candidatus Desulfosporosinus infrequens]|uniref:Uncharacterized protein n=1 Tax=Candidatus Desulfosporosinus infrequens TaxID=2043169 RepID=A0A2U3KGI9_9FIRM|nr:hypothetical protein SBF1_1970017 [Candidatus Desulfosporosinus infrequens]